MEALATHSHRELQSSRNSSNEVSQARDPADANYFPVNMDDNLDDGILRQKLHEVAKQREDLQQIEIELRAQFLARSEIVDMHNTFDAEIKEYATANAKLQEQLREREKMIIELEKTMEEKDREMHALRLDTKAAWAKEDLLREQNLELQTYRRERDSSEAERAQHIKQIHDLQEHMQEKERQFLELQEQNRISQETIHFKDEQLREAQNWISRVQEMDVLQSSTHHTLQAELRERTDLYNQLWLGCRQQYGEMERLHLYIQQLQHELTEAREKRGLSPDSSLGGQTNSSEFPQPEQRSSGEVDARGNNMAGGNPNVPTNDNAENSPSLVSMEKPSTQANQSNWVQMAPASLIGLPSYLPAGQISALHPFVIHQQVPSNTPQAHVSHLHPIAALQELHNQQVFETVDKSCSVSAPSLESIHQISSQFHEALKVDLHEHNGENKEKNLNHLTNNVMEAQGPMNEEPGSNANSSQSETPAHDVNFSNVTMNDGSVAVVPEVFSSTGRKDHQVVEKLAETPLLDEKTLLACIVRTIPPGSGGKIKISSTLPNRLGKMLAPLHWWHDYRKKYGKLDEFVAGHPELFVIEGDYIQLKEGAQEIIAATAAVAKVAAATAATSRSQHLPSIAVTPMAQSHRFKIPTTESISFGKTNNSTPLPDIQNQHRKGNCFQFAGGASNVQILSKRKDHLEPNGSESRSVYSAGLNGTNGTYTNRKELGTYPSKVSANGMVAANIIGGQRGWAIGPTTTSGR